MTMLKSYYENGEDYFEMFMPFVESTISSLNKKRFTQGQVQDRLKDEYGLQVPSIALSQMLNRFKGRNEVIKEAGSYVIQGEIGCTNLESAREEANVKLRTLCKALQSFASEKGINYETVEDAASSLFGFFERYHSEVLLSNGFEYSLGNIKQETKVLSRFIYDECQSDNGLYDCLNTVVVGYTFQDALTLRNIATPPKEFGELQVYFDSGFLFGLLGYEGKVHERAYTETTQLLERTGARLRCFQTTIDEMKRILDLYRRKLRTTEGRSELRQTPLTRYFLSSNSTSGDVNDIMALLEKNLEDKGIQIYQRPERNTRYTLNEDNLYERLSDEGANQREEISHRVDHDVNCTASILTMRHGQRPPDLDSAVAVFASTSKRTVATIRSWYEEQTTGSLSPVLTVTEVSNKAWLKRPYAATDLKMNELVALCYAALRPSDEAWSKFKRRLDEMVKEGEINSDEKAAIVASRYTDHFLSEAEEEADLDESTLNEVVYRVKEKYQEEAKERIQKVRENAQSEVADLQEEVHELKKDRDQQATDAKEQRESFSKLIDLIASGISNSVYYGTAIVLALGLYVGLPEDLRIRSLSVPYVNKGTGLLVLVLTFLNLLFGWDLLVLREACRRKVSTWIKKTVDPE